MTNPTPTPDAPTPDLSLASPRPWMRDRRETVVDANGLPVVAYDVGISHRMSDPSERERANGALLLAAVNGYDAAQARIRDLEAALRNAIALGRIQYGNTDDCWNAVEDQARAALSSGDKP